MQPARRNLQQKRKQVIKQQKINGNTCTFTLNDLKSGTYTATAEYKGFKASNRITVKQSLITKNKAYKKARTITAAVSKINNVWAFIWFGVAAVLLLFGFIIGIVIAATLFTIPVAAFTASVSSCLIHLLFVVLGTIVTLALDKFNSGIIAVL